QTGGAGQFAEVSLRVEPNAGNGFEFLSQVVGGSISSSFFPSIEKGVRSVLEQGVIAGFPIVDVQANVFDGQERPVDSTDSAVQAAGGEGYGEALQEAHPVLCERVMEVKVTVPESMMGDIMGDLNTRRARVQGMDNDGPRSIVTASVPLAEMMRYG